MVTPSELARVADIVRQAGHRQRAIAGDDRGLLDLADRLVALAVAPDEPTPGWIPSTIYARHHGLKLRTVQDQCDRGELTGIKRAGRWFVLAHPPSQ